MPRLLVVTAVPAEAAAVLDGFEAAPGRIAGVDTHRALTPAGLVDVVAGGVGPVAAALTTAAVLTDGGYDLVLSAGIGGGFGPLELVVANSVVFADLGAQLADGGFSSVAELGFGESSFSIDPTLVETISARTGAIAGPVLTVATVTGTAARATSLLAAHPDAVAEGMEGFGVAAAAHRRNFRFGEVRSISNPVGPRDRASWQLGPALGRLGTAFAALLTGGPL